MNETKENERARIARLSQVEGVLIAVLGGVGLWFLFMYLSAAVAAILFGPVSGPGFIRRAAWLYARPRSKLEWSGLGIMVSIALITQMTAFELARSYEQSLGALGRALMQLEVAAAVAWLVYLAIRYVKH